MSSRHSTLKGVQDIFPPEIYIWNKIESAAKEVLRLYGFKEIRIPVIESTEVFSRSIGETTDIVQKEMYTFNDRAGRSVTLRPEGTASVVRSYIQHNLYNQPSPQKYYYFGPMFRYERPQKGRLRQFYQIGAEVFGSHEPKMDAEILSMINLFFERIVIKDISYEINSIGCKQCRPEYKKNLLEFLSEHVKEKKLCNDCKIRIKRNPMRVFDCKVEECINLRKEAPVISDFLCEDCVKHDSEFKSYLTLLDIPYLENPEIVRGLDYYTRSTFEVTTKHLGAQNAVVAGGRYDNLVEEFGGPATPAIGFAIGMERLALLLKDSVTETGPEIFFALLGKDAEKSAIAIYEKLRNNGIVVETGNPVSSLKSQLRRADRMKSRYVVIIGDSEISSRKAIWKRLSDSTQGEIELDDTEGYIKLLKSDK